MKAYRVKYYDAPYTIVVKETFEIYILDNQRIEQLRSLIAEKVGEDPQKIKLFVNGKSMHSFIT